MAATLLDVEAVRARFSSLSDGGFVFLDAPGGSQVPDEVGDAIARTLREASANNGAPYETSRRVEAIYNQARFDAGGFLNCSADDVIFGANMTKLDDRVRVVACVAAANSVGTVTDVARVSELAHAAGALCWVDAVHYAAHEPIDVEALGCDVLLCSPYKYCGPHLGLAYGRHELMESWRPYKARPAGTTPVGRKFETGTAPYELLAGFSATIAYLESLGGMDVLKVYERELGQRFPDGLPESVAIYGLQTMEGRVPTFLLNVDGVEAAKVATTMAERGYGVWAHDNRYSLGLREQLPYPH